MSDERAVVRRAFQSARNRTTPKIAEFDDGRVFEFPGDLEAGRLLDFLEQYGDVIGDADNLPASVAPAFLRIVFAEQWDALNKPASEGGLFLSEMTELSNWLSDEYGLNDARQAQQGDDSESGDNPPSESD